MSNYQYGDTNEDGSVSLNPSASIDPSGDLTVASSKITDTGNVTGASGASTLNEEAGIITTEALTTANAATYTETLTNSFIKAASELIITVMNGTNTVEPPEVSGYVCSAGSVVITLLNSAGAALNGTLKIQFEVIS